MDDGPLTRLEQLFPRIDVLAPPARLGLSSVLAPPASLPAVLAEEIADLPVPHPIASDVRRAVRLVVEKGLGPAALVALRAQTLSDIVPLIRTCAAGPILSGGPVRVRELLRRQGATRWADLAGVTLGEMAEWTNVGPSALAVVVGAAVESALASSTPSEAGGLEPEPPPLADPASRALAVLVQHERVTGGDRLRRALEAHANGDGPPEVRTAAARLLRAADRAGGPQVLALDEMWEAAGDHRDRSVLAGRALRLDRRLSTKVLGHALGISDQRVQQIQARAEQRARDAAAGGVVPALAADLGDRLGPACRLSAVDGALADLGLPPHGDARSALLVWLAGPYAPIKAHDGWVATDPAALVAETRRLLHLDGGVRQLDHVTADLEAAGIPCGDAGDWLATHEVVLLDGLVVSRSGTGADVSERLLSATGRAMTATELAGLAGTGSDTGATPSDATAHEGRLRRDPRFIRVDRHHFELAEWGGTPFREAPPPAPAELFPGAGRAAPSGRSQLRIEVDAAVLRGASAAVPLSVAEALGLACGGRRTFTTRYGPVALTRTADLASRGSVRPIALAAGARAGDALVIDFDAATGDASVDAVLASQSAAS